MSEMTHHEFTTTPTELLKQTLHSPLSTLLNEHNTFCLHTPHHHVYASRSRSLTYVCLIRTSELACMIPGIIGGLFSFLLSFLGYTSFLASLVAFLPFLLR